MKNKEKNISLLVAFKITGKWFKYKPWRNIICIIFLSIILSSFSIAIYILTSGINDFNDAGKTIYNYSFCRVSKITDTISSTGIKLEKISYPTMEFSNTYSHHFLEEYLPFDNVLGTSIRVLSLDKSEYYDISFEPDIGRGELLWGTHAERENEVVVNEAFLKRLKLKKDDLLDFKVPYEFSNIVKTVQNEKTIYDKYNLSLNFKIVGISKETSSFSIPVIYYSYSSIFTLLKKVYLNNFSLEMNKAISIIDRLEIYSSSTDDLKGYSAFYRCPDPYSLMIETEGKYKVSSIALNNISNSQEIVKSLMTVFILFFVMLFFSATALEILTIKTLYEEQLQKLALFKSFHLKKKNYKKVFYSLSKIFAISIFFLTIAFQRIFVQIIGQILVHINFPNIVAIPLTSWINLAVALINYVFSFFSASLAFRSIEKKNIISVLKEE